MCALVWSNNVCRLLHQNIVMIRFFIEFAISFYYLQCNIISIQKKKRETILWKAHSI